jgi:hypothetical protein
MRPRSSRPRAAIERVCGCRRGTCRSARRRTAQEHGVVRDLSQPRRVRPDARSTLDGALVNGADHAWQKVFTPRPGGQPPLAASGVPGSFASNRISCPGGVQWPGPGLGEAASADAAGTAARGIAKSAASASRWNFIRRFDMCAPITDEIRSRTEERTSIANVLPIASARATSAAWRGPDDCVAGDESCSRTTHRR